MDMSVPTRTLDELHHWESKDHCKVSSVCRSCRETNQETALAPHSPDVHANTKPSHSLPSPSFLYQFLPNPRRFGGRELVPALIPLRVSHMEEMYMYFIA